MNNINLEVKPEKSYALNLVRGVAIILVMLHHQFWFSSTNEPVLSILKGGWLGVDLFFVLSGFLITSILLKIFYQKSNQTLTIFFHNRVKRLAPALLVFLSVWIIFFIFDTGNIQNILATSYNDSTSIFVTAFWGIISPIAGFANYAIMFLPFPVSLGHLWSLGIEWQFYAFLPLFFLLIQLSKRKLSFGMMLTLFISLYTFALIVFIVFSSSVENAYLGTPGRFLAVFTGSLVAVLLSPVFEANRYKLLSHKTIVLGAGLPLVFLVLIIIWFTADKSSFTTLTIIMPITGVLSGVLIFLTAQIPNSFFLWLSSSKIKIFSWICRIFDWFGRRSYAAYLWNWTIVFVLYSLILENENLVLFPNPLMNTMVYLAIIWVTTWALAEASWHFVEKKWILLKKS